MTTQYDLLTRLDNANDGMTIAISRSDIKSIKEIWRCVYTDFYSQINKTNHEEDIDKGIGKCSYPGCTKLAVSDYNGSGKFYCERHLGADTHHYRQ